MQDLTLETVSYNDCTIGRLRGNGVNCFTLELPWINNHKNISCIPAGVYKFKYRVSPSLGGVLHLIDVDDRTWIYIHSGNYTRRIKGCILIGDSIRYLDGDTIPDVTNSRITLDNLLRTFSSGTIEVIRHGI